MNAKEKERIFEVIEKLDDLKDYYDPQNLAHREIILELIRELELIADNL